SRALGFRSLGDAPGRMCWLAHGSADHARLSTGTRLLAAGGSHDRGAGSAWSLVFRRRLLPIAPNAARGQRGPLERWVRERKDDRDVFRVTGRGAPLPPPSRTIAILEAHRRGGRAFFRWSDGRLMRIGRVAPLPLPVGRALRLCSPLAPGPVQSP